MVVSADHYLLNSIGRINHRYGRFRVSAIYLYTVLKKTPEIALQSAGRPTVTSPVVSVTLAPTVP